MLFQEYRAHCRNRYNLGKTDMSARMPCAKQSQAPRCGPRAQPSPSSIRRIRSYSNCQSVRDKTTPTSSSDNFVVSVDKFDLKFSMWQCFLFHGSKLVADFLKNKPNFYGSNDFVHFASLCCTALHAGALLSTSHTALLPMR